MADCPFYDLTCKARSSITGAMSGMVHSAFERVCQAFADAGTAVLKAVSDAFLSTSSIDLGKSGVDRILAITTGIGMVIALLLLLGQVLRTGLSMRGEHLAQGVVGVFKAALVTGTVLAVTTALLAASDALTNSIMGATFGNAKAFSDRFAHAVTFYGASSANAAAPVALLLVFGLVAVLVGALLFGEMLFRHAAVVVLVAVSPIAAAGMVGGSTAAWWRKLATAGLQLIFLKPLIVLVFAVGFGMAGNSTDTLGILAGLVTLVIAAFAWPVLARFCTWTSTHVAEAGGLTAFVGGYLGAESRGFVRRAVSNVSQSSVDSTRATMARNHSRVDSAMSGALVGAGAVAGAGAAAGAARATGQYLRDGYGGMAEHGGLSDQPPRPRQAPDGSPRPPAGPQSSGPAQPPSPPQTNGRDDETPNGEPR